MKKSLLSIAVNGALGLTTVATIISSIPAMAQENTTQVEEILVTGSRIARDPLSTTGPITLLSAEDISRSGVGTIDELLNQLPSMGTTGIGGNDNNGGQGVAFADLRNLGTERTLVLVNGRRYVSSAASNVSGVDLNNIPVDMIERIEVLTDGASAVYGADAVAGVINIVMKDSFEGVRISARAGATGEGDGENGDLSITFGGEGERGQFIANISHSQRNEIAMKDRDWAHVLSSRTPNGNISTKYGQFTVGADGASLTDDHTLYDIGQYMWLSGAMERTSASFSGTFSITDSVEAFGEASYTRKTTNQQMAAQPMATDSGFKINPIVNLSDELQNQLEGKWQKYQDDLPQNQEKWRAENPGKDDSLNPYKPVDSWNGGFNDLLIRPVAGGTRDSEQTTDTYRFLGGLRGDFKNGWNWEAFASYGRNEGEDISTNNYNKAKLKEVLEGKTDIDPVIHGSLSPELIEYFRYTDRADNIYTLSNVGASLTGDIDAITFQGGALGFAAGMEYRREAGRYNPSEETRKGDTFGNQQDGTGGSYTVTEAFAEFNLPILEGARFAEELAVDVAMRYSDFDNFGGQSTGKLGLVYAPIETLRFRASLSNSYRAPGIYELYSGSVQSYEPLIDPCDTRADINKAGQGVNCAIVGTGFKHDTTQIPTNIGGNDKLTPEEATTLTTGLVWTPAFVDDLSITLDYFDIQIDNAIDQPNLQGLLDDCYRKGIAASCEFVTRNSDSGQVSRLEGALENLGRVDTRGIDVDLVQNFDFDAGRLALRLQATRMLEYTIYNEEANTEDNRLGKVLTSSNGIYTKWRGLASTTWYGNNWDVGIDVKYLDGGETSAEEPVAVHSRTYLNLKGGWDVSEELRLSAGIDNLTDQEPQDLNGNGSFASAYDFRGRYAWAGVNYQF